MIDNSVLKENLQGLSLLYVEDDHALSDVTAELLNLYFDFIDVAYDGEEGLQKYEKYFDKHGTHYSIVITDINMPNMDGIEMSKNILHLNEMQSIIIVTAYDAHDYMQNAIDLGIDGFLSKPLRKEQLLKILFKVSKKICDCKFVDDHINKIENLNLELEEKNKELEKSFRMLDTMVLTRNNSQEPTEIVSNKQDEPSFSVELEGQIEQLVNEDLLELTDILIEIDVHLINVINHIDEISENDLLIIMKNFQRYSAILHFYTFFNDLSFAMLNFSETIQNNPLPEDKEVISNIFTLLETFVYVLSKWQNAIKNTNEQELNQFDSSMINDMQTIVILWMNKEEVCSDEDLDDIFDF